MYDHNDPLRVAAHSDMVDSLRASDLLADVARLLPPSSALEKDGGAREIEATLRATASLERALATLSRDAISELRLDADAAYELRPLSPRGASVGGGKSAEEETENDRRRAWARSAVAAAVGANEGPQSVTAVGFALGLGLGRSLDMASGETISEAQSALDDVDAELKQAKEQLDALESAEAKLTGTRD
jgi:hypothetical protein